MKLQIKVNRKTLNLEKPIKLIELAKSNSHPYYAAKVNNRLHELDYLITENCEIELLDLTDVDACLIYENTLRYVTLMAIKNLYPKAKARFNYWISRSLALRITGLDRKMDQHLVDEIRNEINNIIKANYPIVRKTEAVDDIIKYYQKNNYADKQEILTYRTEKTVHIYECENYKNYMFGYMLPSTGYLELFKLFYYHPMIILQYPRAELKGHLPNFIDAPKFGKTLLEAEAWTHICACQTISGINKKIEEKKHIDLINMCEARHGRMLADLGNQIQSDIDNLKLIVIAGPSSSGKTTFSNRLRIELLSRGINPIMISIDDYYLGVKEAPLDVDGKPDLEHIDALDIELFNKDMLSLIMGEEVILPRFNFNKGIREVGEKIQLGEKTPIIIEGIHALNDQLTYSIPRSQKYKIYMAPQQQIRIDNHNPIRMTDIRFLRRIVRDSKYRNTDVRKTISMWSSVRRGEFHWIYDNQEDANFIFNSELTYELGVLKKYALPVLENIKTDEEHFITANRLIKFLKYFKDIDDFYVPCNSLLREFIGGSCFYD